MNIKARDRESIKKVIVLSSITNSYVEGTASSIDVCGQTVRNNLKQQDPESVLKYNEEILKKMRISKVFELGIKVKILLLDAVHS